MATPARPAFPSATDYLRAALDWERVASDASCRCDKVRFRKLAKEMRAKAVEAERREAAMREAE